MSICVKLISIVLYKITLTTNFLIARPYRYTLFKIINIDFTVLIIFIYFSYTYIETNLIITYLFLS